MSGVACEDVRPQLTAYLDGELEDAEGSVVRGHLRGCEACRQISADEAVLRDGLRALPSVDVPASLWAGVQAQLAAAEVADAERPSWRRAVARWTPVVRRSAPTAGGVVLAMAAAIAFVAWRHHGADLEAPAAPSAPGPIATEVPTPVLAPEATVPPPAGSATFAAVGPSAPADDVTADLAQDAARATAAYAATVDDLSAQLVPARSGWDATRRAGFDARLAELASAAASAEEGHPRQRALRAEIRFLQGALVRDEIALNERTFAAPGAGPGAEPGAGQGAARGGLR